MERAKTMGILSLFALTAPTHAKRYKNGGAESPFLQAPNYPSAR